MFIGQGFCLFLSYLWQTFAFLSCPGLLVRREFPHEVKFRLEKNTVDRSSQTVTSKTQSIWELNIAKLKFESEDDKWQFLNFET